MKNIYFLLFVCITFIATTVEGRTFVKETNQININSIPESCDCTIDTAGFAVFVETLAISDNPMKIYPHNKFAVLIGYVDETTPALFKDLIDNNPEVTTLVFFNSSRAEGSTSTDEIGKMIRDAKYKVFIPWDGYIAYGVVDIFTAGVVRVIEKQAQLVVGAWANDTAEATDYPVGHAYHLPFINYYVSVGFTQKEAEDFYYFTINAAPSDKNHIMTEAELDKYKIRTCKYTAICTDGGEIFLNGKQEEFASCNQGEVFRLSNNSTVSSAAYLYIFTDENGVILDTSSFEDDFAIEGLESSLIINIWGVSYTGKINSTVGENITTVNSDGDFQLSSNYVRIVVAVVDGGQVHIDGKDTLFVNAGVMTEFTVTSSSKSTENYAIIFTEEDGTIFFVDNDYSEGTRYELKIETESIKLCGLSSQSMLVPDDVIGKNINDITLDSCYQFSSSCGVIVGDNVTGIPASNFENEIVVFPTKTSTTFSIKGEKIASVNVISMNGKVMFSSEEKTNYDISRLAKGLYIVQVTTLDGSRLSSKLIKE